MATFDSIALNAIKICPTTLRHAFPTEFPEGWLVDREEFITHYEGRLVDDMLKWNVLETDRNGFPTVLQEEPDPFSSAHISDYTILINRFENGHSVNRRFEVSGRVYEQITTSKNGKWFETRDVCNGEVISRMFGDWDTHGNLTAITTVPKPDRYSKGDWKIEDGAEGKVRNWYNREGELIDSAPISRVKLGELTFETIGDNHFQFRDHAKKDLASSEKMPAIRSGDVVNVHDSDGRYIGFVDQGGTFRLSRIFNEDGAWSVMRSSRPFREYAKMEGKIPTSPILVRKGAVRPEFEKIL